MRALAAIVVALVLAPVATAAKPPLPIPSDGVHILRITPLAKHQASCAVHSRAKTKLGKASRKVLPVACEQPPRSQLIGSGSITAVLAP
jgi:hypothetical protein